MTSWTFATTCRTRRDVARRLAVALTWLLIATAGYAADTQIIAGQRIGNIALGMPHARVHELLGEPQSSYRSKRHRLVEIFRPGDRDYPTASIEIEFDRDTVADIATNSSLYQTADGLKRGSDIDSLRAHHAQLKTRQFLVHRSGGVIVQCHDDAGAGIVFEYDADATSDPVYHLAMISVHAAGKPGRCSRDDDPRAAVQTGK